MTKLDSMLPKPFAIKDNIPIVIASDSNYAPYVAVTLQSIIENAKPENNYDIIILSMGISECAQQKILRMVAAQSNFLVRFIDMETFFAQHTFFVDRYLSLTTYARLFIPDIMKKYKKAVYLDCDIVLCRDVADLFFENSDHQELLAIHDVWGHPARVNNTGSGVPRRDYAINILKMPRYLDYFNAGVLVFNLQEMHKNKTQRRFWQRVKEIEHPLCHDQDILNSACYGHVRFLSNKWNFINCFSEDSKSLKILPQEIQEAYIEARQNPYLIHYAGRDKVWKHPEMEYSEFWWQYARHTPFYEEIIFRNTQVLNLPNINQIRDVINYRRYKMKYHMYKILTHLTLGRTHHSFKELKKRYKWKVKGVKLLMEGKK